MYSGTLLNRRQIIEKMVSPRHGHYDLKRLGGHEQDLTGGKVICTTYIVVVECCYNAVCGTYPGSSREARVRI